MILRLRRGKRVHVVEVRDVGGSARVRIDGELFEADIVRLADGAYSVLAGGCSVELSVTGRGGGWEVWGRGRTIHLRPAEEAGTSGSLLEGAAVSGQLRATLPGRILEVKVEEGDEVGEGEGLVIMEAMKMENELRSAFAARIGRVAVEKGQSVEAGQLLCVLEPLGEPAC